MSFRTPLAVVGFVALGFVLGHAQQPDRHWLHRTGDDWVRLSPAAKAAYIEGFLAGSAFAQDAAGHDTTAAPSDSGAGVARAAARLEQLRRTGGLRFPYGANVYMARIDDYYWWANHRPMPTWFALWEVNTDLRRQSDTGDARR
jgi:hypothetical protein